MSAIGDHLRLLGDETRLRVLHLLESEPLTVAELQDVLDLGQSSISGHLAKLKQAGLIHDLPEGSARRYRIREDAEARLRSAWSSVRDLSRQEAQFASDARRLSDQLRNRGTSWVDRVAGSLHREYAPGRTWESLCHGLQAFARFGRCIDVGAGDGAMIELIAPQADSLTCIDPSPAMVAAGTAKVKALGLDSVRYILAPGEQLPLEDASCDAVLFLQSLQYIADPAAALGEAARALAPGGRLLVITLLKHDFAEANRYGHRHSGFAPEELKRWTRTLAGHRTVTLPAETRPPRFQTVILTAVKSVDAGRPRRSAK
ncbi:MAG: metalloregulator ArsR/SmtB family transcription factor [Planctomycetes bacterium]|nr:metalloregulator ArsR/SmtB family transcription factor [Planctomycetota bacterium]